MRNIKSFKIVRRNASVWLDGGYRLPRYNCSIQFMSGAVASHKFASLQQCWDWLKRFDSDAIVSVEATCQ